MRSYLVTKVKLQKTPKSTKNSRENEINSRKSKKSQEKTKGAASGVREKAIKP
jgi:ribosome assembly protein YihI (activator of Der GTPase)